MHRLYELGEKHMSEGSVVGFFGAGQKASSYFAVDNVEIQVEIEPEPTTTTTTEPPATTTSTKPPKTTTTTKPPATTSTTTTTTVAPPPTTTTTTVASAPPPPDPPEDISEMARYTEKSDLAMTELGASVAMIDLEAEPQLPERSPITQIVATMTTSAATVRLHLLPAIALGLLVSLFVIRGVAPEEQLEV